MTDNYYDNITAFINTGVCFEFKYSIRLLVGKFVAQSFLV